MGRPPRWHSSYWNSLWPRARAVGSASRNPGGWWFSQWRRGWHRRGGSVCGTRVNKKQISRLGRGGGGGEGRLIQKGTFGKS